MLTDVKLTIVSLFRYMRQGKWGNVGWADRANMFMTLTLGKSVRVSEPNVDSVNTVVIPANDSHEY